MKPQEKYLPALLSLETDTLQLTQLFSETENPHNLRRTVSAVLRSLSGILKSSRCQPDRYCILIKKLKEIGWQDKTFLFANEFAVFCSTCLSGGTEHSSEQIIIWILEEINQNWDEFYPFTSEIKDKLCFLYRNSNNLEVHEKLRVFTFINMERELVEFTIYFIYYINR